MLIAIGIFEAFGRLAPLTTSFRAGMSYLRFHSQLGFELDPNVGSFPYEQACLNIRKVSIDSEGNRTSSTDTISSASNAALRIAVLGDSFMMAREVSDDENITAILGRAIDNSDVINFGVPGYGTIQAYLSYILKASKVKPDITVLGFLDVNDVVENSAYLSKNDGLANVRPYFADDKTTILPPRSKFLAEDQQQSLPHTIHRFLKEHLFTYYAAYTYGVTPLKKLIAKTRATGNASNSSAVDKGNQSKQAGAAGAAADFWWQRQGIFTFLAMYQREPDEQFEAAWRATEAAVLLLRDAVVKDGGHFVVMLVPAENASWMASALEQYKKEFGKPAPPGFDLRYPAERMIRFGRKNNFDVLDLGPTFAAYRDRHALLDPYFHFRCDGHWSPLGHYIAAQRLTEHLTEQGILKDGQRNNAAYMERSPQDLLGTAAVDSIFGWGKTYLGGSNIAAN